MNSFLSQEDLLDEVEKFNGKSLNRKRRPINNYQMLIIKRQG